MGAGVIADPVPFGMRPLCQRAIPGQRAFADYEERRPTPRRRNTSSTDGVTSGVGTVVEREREVEHGTDHTRFGEA